MGSRPASCYDERSAWSHSPSTGALSSVPDWCTGDSDEGSRGGAWTPGPSEPTRTSPLCNLVMNPIKQEVHHGDQSRDELAANRRPGDEAQAHGAPAQDILD